MRYVIDKWTSRKKKRIIYYPAILLIRVQYNSVLNTNMGSNISVVYTNMLTSQSDAF